MKLQIVPEARKLVFKMWSSKLLLISIALVGVEIMLPLWEHNFPRNVFLGLSAVISMASFAAKFFVQQDPRSDEAKTQHVVAATPPGKKVDLVAIVTEDKEQHADPKSYEYESGL